MTREALEHLLRAAAALTNERDFIVIGSQAILGQRVGTPPAVAPALQADTHARL